MQAIFHKSKKCDKADPPDPLEQQSNYPSNVSMVTSREYSINLPICFIVTGLHDTVPKIDFQAGRCFSIYNER